MLTRRSISHRVMVYLPPPHLALPSRPSYAEIYADILKAHRRSPLTSASSVIILVAPDVDALCAARMLADLFKQDDVMHRVIPVSGIAELERMRNELMSYTEVIHNVRSIMQSRINRSDTAPYADFTEHGCNSGPSFIGVVWRLRLANDRTRH